MQLGACALTVTGNAESGLTRGKAINRRFDRRRTLREKRGAPGPVASPASGGEIYVENLHSIGIPDQAWVGIARYGVQAGATAHREISESASR